MLPYLQVIFSYLIGFFLVNLSIPVLVRVCHTKKLFEHPDERRVHTQAVPNIGGIAIFIGFSLSVIISLNGMTFPELLAILGALIVMFFIGLKDDLIVISPRKKLGAQIITAIMLIVLGNFRFTNLHGMFGIFELPAAVGFIFSLLVIVFLINALNLIDGIDGLSSGIGMLSLTVFGVLFMLEEQFPYAIICFAAVGSLSSFFIYNVFGKTNKLFMGDTGSLILGTIIATVFIKYNELHIPVGETSNLTPILTLSVIIVPTFDTLRVFVLRIFKGKSPFAPDKNHIHHLLLALGLTHIQATLTILSANVFLVVLTYLVQPLGVHITGLILLVLTAVLFGIPAYLVKTKDKR